MPVAMVKRAFLNDLHCGDQVGYWPDDGKTTLCIVDGLGHGEDAEVAAKAATEYVAHHRAQPLPDLFTGCDRALRRTRGAAMGIAVIDQRAGTLTYAGIGNTRAVIIREPDSESTAGPVLSEVEDKSVCLSSNHGIMGGGYRTLTPETVPLNPGDLVILTTDGIKERCDILAYGDALRGDVRRLAERILHDWGRETDDAAVLVFRSGS